MTFKEKLTAWGACSAALLWLGDRTEQQALAECDRGDWLLWWFFREKDNAGYPDIRKITLAKVGCARLVQHLMKDPRSLNALDVAERFGNGQATQKEMKVAAYAAAAAADAAAAYAAAAAYDAATAAYAAAAAYDAAARATMLKQCADICRLHFFTPENTEE